MFPWKPAGEAFFGFDMAVGHSRLVIVEGMFDAIRVGPGALSLLGKGITDTRLDLLRELKRKGAQTVTVWFDADVSQQERHKIYERVNKVIPAQWTVSRSVKDAGDSNDDQVRETLGQADVLGFCETLGLDD
jgi:hypothetical protein